MELKELIKKIEQWAIDRELDKKATVEAQSIKTAEEMSELIIGISKGNIDVIKDSIGDVFVTLVVGNMIDKTLDIEEIYNTVLEDLNKDIPANKNEQIVCLDRIMEGVLTYKYDEDIIYYILVAMLGDARIYDLDFIECVESAYNEIKDRKGKTIDGQFIKEEDL